MSVNIFLLKLFPFLVQLHTWQNITDHKFTPSLGSSPLLHFCFTLCCLAIHFYGCPIKYRGNVGTPDLWGLWSIEQSDHS